MVDIKLGESYIRIKSQRFEIPWNIKRPKTHLVLSKGEVYLNGHWLDQKNHDWHWSLKAWLISVIL